MHSRRSYSYVNSRETAELWAFHWAIDSMKSLCMNNVIFESSSEGARACLLGPCFIPEVRELARQIIEVVHSLQYWSLEHVFLRGTSWRNELQRVLPSNSESSPT